MKMRTWGRMRLQDAALGLLGNTSVLRMLGVLALLLVSQLFDLNLEPLGLFFLAGPTTDVSDRQKELDRIIEEAEKLQSQYKGKRWDPKDRERFEALCKEGDQIQQEIAAEQDWNRLQEKGRQLREVPDPTLPNSRSHMDGMGVAKGREVAGYISVGDAVLMSEAFRKFAEQGYPRGQVAVVQLASAMAGKNILYGPRGEPLIALTRSERKSFEDFLGSKEMKAVPTIGAGVLEPDRVARVAQQTANERLTIRDVISTGQTTASSVEYVRDDSTPDLVTPTAHGVEKPEVDAAYSLQSAPVRTVAGWMPVQNQQLEDWAQLRGLLDGRLRYIIQRSEEQQILWGTGTPPEIEGVLVVAGTTDIASNGRYNGANHTLIDVVRMGITDVLLAGYQANAVVIHPIDWETILLEKGTDDRYVWAVVTDNNGSRIWGIRAVESIGAQDRETGARELVVADWQMGAQLLDRMAMTVQVGLIDRQLIENMRTILAEERIALPIYAPAAFAHFETSPAYS